MTNETTANTNGHRPLLNILIVDEDPDSRVSARKALQRGQFEVTGEAGYGNQAISLALATHPDAVLVAVEEPAARALETSEGIASALPDTPIIIYSTIEDAASVRRAMVFGASDYLLKPLQGSAVRAAILRSLEREELRQLRRSGRVVVGGKGTVISVTGAKGGVGKSVVAVNLALALRLQTGKSVAILDADTQFGDVATMLDLTPTQTAYDLIRSLDHIDRTNYRDFVTVHPSGLQVIAAHDNEDAWRDATREQLQKIISLLAEVHEFVVIDTSGSFDAFVRTCIEASTLSLVVTSGEVSSVRDTGAAMRRLQTWGVDNDRVRLVLNRGRKAPGVSAKDVERSVGRAIFWDLPFDSAVPDSVQYGRPVVTSPKAPAFAKSLASLALRIAGTNIALVQEKPRGASFWKRFAGIRGNGHEPVAAEPEALDAQR